jgi:hypothetical protein
MAITDILGPALTIGRSLLTPTRAIDVVAILGPGFSPLFQFARPLEAEITETAILMEHPLEDGATIADHIVFDPMEIRIPLMIVGETEYRSTYALIRQTFKTGALLTVVTRTGSYPNMVIEEMPHREDPAGFNAVSMRIRLREANFVTPKSGGLASSQVKDAKQASTVGRGTQQTTATNAASSAKAGDSYNNSGLGQGATGSTLYRWAYGE